MPLTKTYRAIAAFLKMEFAGGAVLFAAALAAVIAANAENTREWYGHVLHLPVGLVFGEGRYALSMAHFINDGLMAVFFLLVGLEIKRELLAGELSTRARALLPFIAAAGGMLCPALIFAAFNGGDAQAMRGWAIPTATDIAFALGVLSLLGKRAPFALKIFLLAVAVIDDLGAIVIIALFYSGKLAATPLLLSFAVLFAMGMLNRCNVCSRVPYLLLGVVLWACVLQSGLHATLAGVLAAFMVPLRAPEGKQAPLEPLEHDLHVLVTFIILPLFAFANAGVSFVGLSPDAIWRPLPLGIMAGLLAGKMIGITGASWLAVRAGIAELPRGCSWAMVCSLSLLCGIGFTMSLFIGNLAFAADNAELVNFVKLGVLTGSTIAGVCGYLMLHFYALPQKSSGAS